MSSKQPVQMILVDFTDEIASGASSQKSYKNDTGRQLLVDAIGVDVWISAAGAGAIPAYPEATPTKASNTGPARSQFRLQVDGTSLGAWQTSNRGTRLSLIAGTADRPAWLKTPFVIQPGEQINVTLYNDSAEAVKAQMACPCTVRNG